MNKKSVAIKVSNLIKRFGPLVAVNNVSFEIIQGEIVGILGPNGAGKTTTIRLLTGVFNLENDARIEIFGKDIIENPTRYKNDLGIVPEVSNAFLGYSVWQNLKFSGGIYGLSKDEIEKRSNALLNQFDLIGRKHSKTKTLSKGLKQRLNLCQALLHNPPILILDEPTSGLDPISVNLMRKQILKLKREGKTILITTHDMQEAQNMCDRILIMNKGKIIADESPDTLREQFKSTSTILIKIEGGLSAKQESILSEIGNFVKEKSGYYGFSSENALKDIANLYQVTEENNINITALKIKDTSLEEVFIHLIESDLISIEEMGNK